MSAAGFASLVESALPSFLLPNLFFPGLRQPWTQTSTQQLRAPSSSPAGSASSPRTQARRPGLTTGGGPPTGPAGTSTKPGSMSVLFLEAFSQRSRPDTHVCYRTRSGGRRGGRRRRSFTGSPRAILSTSQRSPTRRSQLRSSPVRLALSSYRFCLKSLLMFWELLLRYSYEHPDPALPDRQR